MLSRELGLVRLAADIDDEDDDPEGAVEDVAGRSEKTQDKIEGDSAFSTQDESVGGLKNPSEVEKVDNIAHWAEEDAARAAAAKAVSPGLLDIELVWWSDCGVVMMFNCGCKHGSKGPYEGTNDDGVGWCC